MTEESSNNSFFKDMMSDLMEKDPSLAMQMMLSALKMPVMNEFIEEHKAELDESITVTMTAGEALFLFAACKNAIGTMGNNMSARHDGQLHVHILKAYLTVGMKFAKLVGKIGYPETSAIADMVGAIASVDDVFKDIEEMHEKINSGTMTFDDLMNREVQ